MSDIAQPYVPPYVEPDQAELPEELLAEIVDYLITEDDKASEERQPLDDRVAKWRRQREARPESDRKDTPWPGASNVATPATAIATNGNYSFLRTAFALRRPFWSVSSPDNPEAYGDQALAITELLDQMASSEYQLDLNRQLETIFYTTASEGICAVKLPWIVEHWQFKGKDAAGGVAQISATIHDGPSIIPVPFEDFMVPTGFEDLNTSPWIRHRVYLPEHMMLQRAANNIYLNTEKVMDAATTKFNEMKTSDLERAGITPKETRIWDVREYYVFWDVDGDGIPEDIILTLEYTTKQWLRVEFNDLGIRPWVITPYSIRPNSPYKLGVGWFSELLQDEVDTHRNYRLNAMYLANLRMLVAKRNAGISPKEVMRPGKIIFADNPREDIQVLQFGEVYPSSLEAEGSARSYLQAVTALSNFDIGMSDPNMKYPNTSGMMYLGQQGGMSKGGTIEGLQNALARMGQIILFQIIRNKERLNLDKYDERRRALITEALNVNLADVPLRFCFNVRVTDVNQTEEAQRQKLLSLVQLYTVYNDKMMQMGMVIAQPDVPELVKAVALKQFTGFSRMMDKILKDFGETDTDKYLPDWRKVEQLNAAIKAAQGGMNAGTGTIGGPANMGPGGNGTTPVARPAGQPGMVGGPSPAGGPTGPMAQGAY